MRALVLALSILALSSAGHAEPQPGAARPISEAARPYFDRGAAAYAAGAYSQAIEAFEHGQQLDPHPDFLYALAQAHRKHGDCTRAVVLYQAFLASRPPVAEASRARANLERCPRPPAAASSTAASGAGSARVAASGAGSPGAGASGAGSARAESSVVSSGAAQSDPAPSGARSSSETSSSAAAAGASAPASRGASPAVAADRGEPWYTDAVGDALAGAGLVGLGVGTAYLIASDRTIGVAPDAKTLAEVERITESASRERQIGTWCLIGGGALTAAAIVRYALHRRAGRAPDRAVWVTPQPDSLVVSWGGRL